MAEELPQPAQDSDEEDLPEIKGGAVWWRITGVLAILVIINIVAVLVSFGAGILVTMPLTLFLAFVLFKKIIPRHRFPMGRPRRGTSA